MLHLYMMSNELYMTQNEIQGVIFWTMEPCCYVELINHVQKVYTYCKYRL